MIPLIRRHHEEVVCICREFGVKRLDLFGSAASESFVSETSDLDFIVSFANAGSRGYADRYLGLAEALERLFHRKVDLLTERSIRNPIFRQAVEAQRQSVYDERGREAVA